MLALADDKLATRVHDIEDQHHVRNFSISNENLWKMKNKWQNIILYRLICFSDQCNSTGLDLVLNFEDSNSLNVTSPGWPGNYSAGRTCRWNLIPGNTPSQIIIEFKFFETLPPFDVLVYKFIVYSIILLSCRYASALPKFLLAEGFLALDSPAMQLCIACQGASCGDGLRQFVTPRRY